MSDHHRWLLNAEPRPRCRYQLQARNGVNLDSTHSVAVPVIIRPTAPACQQTTSLNVQVAVRHYRCIITHVII